MSQVVFSYRRSITTPLGRVIDLVPSAELLLDLYPGAAGAYSFRKLRTAYAGNAVRLRRESDDSEQDFGFDGIDFDVAGALSFASTGSPLDILRVVTWYDQSGNARDITQSTPDDQPMYEADTFGEQLRPCMLFDGGTEDFPFNTFATYFAVNPQTYMYVLANPRRIRTAGSYPAVGDSIWNTTGGWYGVGMTDSGAYGDSITSYIFDLEFGSVLTGELPVTANADQVFEWLTTPGSPSGPFVQRVDGIESTPGDVAVINWGAGTHLARDSADAFHTDMRVAEMVLWDVEPT